MDNALQLILFAPPEQTLPASAKALRAPMAYRIGPGPTLQRVAALPDLRGGILAVTGEPGCLAGGGSPQLLLRQLQRECQGRGAAGLWLNLEPQPQSQAAPLLNGLETLAQRSHRPLWVPEWCAPMVSHANLLISSALSGGTLRARLEEAIQTYGQTRVTLAVEPMAEDFALPSPTGQGKPLTGAELQQLMERLHPNVFYSTELCAHYFTFLQRGMPHFILFDNPGSVRKKVALAEQLGLRYGLVPWDFWR
jgi:hypothetical protein